jgi:hypothetical protein
MIGAIFLLQSAERRDPLARLPRGFLTEEEKKKRPMSDEGRGVGASFLISKPYWES